MNKPDWKKIKLDIGSKWQYSVFIIDTKWLINKPN